MLAMPGMLLPVSGADEAKVDKLMKQTRRSNAVYSPHEAAAFGTEEQMRAAVAAEPFHVNITDEVGDTPLHIAARSGKAGAVKILLEAGADAAAKDSSGKTPLQIAEGKSTVKLLEAAAKVRDLELKLSRDVQMGKVATVQAALKDKVNPNALSEDKSCSVLCVAVKARNAEMVEVLIKSGADVNYVTPQNKSVLHLAAVHGDAAIINALLKAGAVPTHPGNNGATPLHDAVWARNSVAVQTLIPAYAEMNFSPDGKNNGYPVEMAIGGARADYVQLFLNAGMKVNDVRFAKRPLLHFAAMQDRAFIVRMLLEAGADKNALDEHGKRAVDYAKGEAAQLLK